MTQPTLAEILRLLEADYLPQAEARASLLWLVEERARLQGEVDALRKALKHEQIETGVCASLAAMAENDLNGIVATLTKAEQAAKAALGVEP